jgi:hypothetical protein
MDCYSASWTSFGSIAFGSFIIAVIKAMRAMAQSGRGAKNGIVRCVVECMLACLDRLVSYFNVYAFTQGIPFLPPFLPLFLLSVLYLPNERPLFVLID